ncbi:MAG: response regulator, partial [Alphaproteobacteria bacterium]
EEARMRAAFQLLDGTQPHPCVLTDLQGRVLDMNAAMRRHAQGRESVEDCVRAFCDDPGPLVHGLARRALTEGGAAELIDPGGGGRWRLTAIRAGHRFLLWRVLRNAVPPDRGPDYREAPFLHLVVDGTGRILCMNRDLAPPGGTPPRQIGDLVADLPLRRGGIHEMRLGLPGHMRCMTGPEIDGRQELFFFPADPAEVQGLTPDRFLDHLPVGLVRIAPGGEVIFANRAARALLGERAVPGVRFASLVEGLARSIPERLSEALRGGAAGRPEIARSVGDERELFLQVSLGRIVLDGDISVLAVVSDATEMKTLEAQFVQSQKMQAVGQLAGGVAHDFNNLLTAIQGHCDLLLLRHEVGDADHGDLVQIRNNVNRAAALVRQLLAFSRKQTLRPRTLHLAETLSELSHLLNRLLGEKVELRIDNGPDLWPVRVDERQFEQVIMNLVVNARDAMPNGGRVEIRTRNLTLEAPMERDRATVPAGEYVLIEVADTGCGIPPDRLRKIFEPFFTTKKLGEGTGLGLSTAYGIIKQTGGFIFVNSVVGQGTTFSIYLPRHEGEVQAQHAEDAAPEPVRDLTGQGVVLLVEDEAPVRSFAARALRLRGYTVLEAASGEEALEMLADPEVRVDVMVSDVVMPGMDGPSWVREALKTRPDARVIFVSGYAEDVFRADGGGLPQAAFLAKPFSLNDLTQKVKEVLGGE